MEACAVGSAPGKIILCGEHTVVHGTHAIAAVVDKRTFVELRSGGAADGKGVLELVVDSGAADDAAGSAAGEGVAVYSWEVSKLREACASVLVPQRRMLRDKPPLLSEAQLAALRALPAATEPSVTIFLFFYLAFGDFAPMRARVTTQLPMGAGLGSSASFNVAIVAAFHGLRAAVLSAGGASGGGAISSAAVAPAPHAVALSAEDREAMNAWAFEGERIIHGNPSGVDNTVSVHGGAILYRRGQPPQFVRELGALRLLVTNTKVKRDTKRLVAGVGDKFRRYPAIIGPVFQSVDAIALRMEALLKELAAATHNSETHLTLLRECALLLEDNQSFLQVLGVSHRSIEEIVAIGRRHGLATKLTGAGGGGCVISLVGADATPAQVEAFQHDVAAAGFGAFQTTVGQGGAEVHVGHTLRSLRVAT
jgi:mevalonate kinase